MLTFSTGAFLVLTFVLNDDRINEVVLFEGLLLIFMSVLNAIFVVLEVYNIRTHNIRRLLGRVTALLDAPCPWTPVSYPPKALSTSRGHFTVPAFRDGVVVNLPTSLLVEGDVILLWRGATAPAVIRLLDDKELELSKGSPVPDELFGGTQSDDTARFTVEEAPLKFEVRSSPLIASLEQAIAMRPKKSVLSKQLNFGLALSSIMSLFYLFVSFLFNIIRYTVLQSDFGPWPEMFLQLQAYSLLPLLCPAFPLLWILANMYCTARIGLLLAYGPSFFEDMSPLQRCVGMLKEMRDMVVHPYRSLNTRMFHTLGSLTSLCAVDKKDILTDTLPVPESVFFLHSLKQDEASAKGEMEMERSGKTNEEEEATTLEEVVGGDEVFSESHSLEPPPTSSEPSNLPTFPDTLTSSDPEHQKGATLHVTFQEATSNSVTRLESQLTNPSITMATTVQAEILNISPNSSSPSGISFDQPTWRNYIASLKPIGLGTLATSHVIHDPFCWYRAGTRSDLKQCLYNTQCMCSLGMEIGVREYSKDKLEQERVIFSISDYTRIPSNAHQKGSTFVHDIQSCTIQPHMISTVMKQSTDGSCLVMSCGSDCMVTSCCSDFWDGTEIHRLTQPERHAILEYYNRHSLTAYCTTLSYSPLQEVPVLPGDQTIGLFIPHAQLARMPWESDTQQADKGATGLSPEYSPNQIFSDVLSNQVFLGMVSMQYQPKPDVVHMIENLHSAGIRFIHLTAENELRSKVFAEKLGLETGWNCHISLAPEPPGGANDSPGDGDERGSVTTGSVSSLESVVNTYQAYICAKLPKGIDNIRPHIQHVDNVPLLVPLFTDCTAASMQEMVKILQENGEVVMCMGNAWNIENILIFSQADIGLALIPELDKGVPSCIAASGCGPSSEEQTESPSQTAHADDDVWSDPLTLASFFNSAACQLSLLRDHQFSVISLVSESRWLLNCLRRALVFGLGTSITLATLMVLAVVFFLPPPLAGGHLFWFILVCVPAIMLTYLTTPVDPSTKCQMPLRRRKVQDDLSTFVLAVVSTFLPTAFLSLLVFGLTLHEFCTLQNMSQCQGLLGNRNSSSPWNGWRGTSEQSLLFAQDLTAFFLSLYIVTLSLQYLHQTKPLWRLWKHLSWPYVVAIILAVLLQVVYFIVSEVFATKVYELPLESGVTNVPFYVWIFGFLWIPVLILLQEVFKHKHRKTVNRLQRHLKLEFETKLGMNSPF